MIIEKTVRNGEVKLHYIEHHPTHIGREQLVPLVFVPGLTESAEDYIELMRAITDRRTIAISLRGRGQSDTPEQGYSLEDHISDIRTVIEDMGLESLILFAFSRGVSYGLGYALQNTKSIAGMILGDYPALHSKLPEQWVDFIVQLPPWRGKESLVRMSRLVYEGIQKDSQEHIFWDELHQIKCPVLILRGGKQGALLTQEVVNKYLEHLPFAQSKTLEHSDHNLFEPDLRFLQEAINIFVKDV